MRKWRNIDNTAKIFSLDFKKNANVFRFSIVLKEKVDNKILEEALYKSLESHEAFRVKLKNGLFWDYFEYNEKLPIIKERKKELTHFDYVRNNNYLFKVTYFNKDSKKDIIVSIPINLRPHYEDETLSNFFTYTNVESNFIGKDKVSFDDCLLWVKDEFLYKLNSEKIK